MNALFHRLSSQMASHWQETWFMKRMMHAGSREKGRLEKECRNHPNQYTTYCNKCKIKTKYKVVHNSDTADYEKPMGQLTIDVRSHFFSNGKKRRQHAAMAPCLFRSTKKKCHKLSAGNIVADCSSDYMIAPVTWKQGASM